MALITVFCCSCLPKEGEDPYKAALLELDIRLEYPEGYEQFRREGVEVTFEEFNSLYAYTSRSDARGNVSVHLPAGIYRVMVSDRMDGNIFNGIISKIVLAEKSAQNLPLVHSKAGTIVIKEIYCGGCQKDAPETGVYQSDQYVILHNNDNIVQYLDGLCFGSLAPYNSNSNSPWGGVHISAPVIQAVWQFGGDGDDFPLAPGEDAVLCLRGAVDHTVQYSKSVNLNRPGYFVCYNNTYFFNTVYHPVPGDKIKPDHYLDVVIKTGQANAYTYSMNSPATIIFRPEGMTIRDYVASEGAVVQIPGSNVDRVVLVPWNWIVDGVEIFNGSTASNNKRIDNSVDAGYVTLSQSGMGYTVMRNVDEEASAEAGYEMLMDTNNSSVDFYERKTASLRDEN